MSESDERRGAFGAFLKAAKKINESVSQPGATKAAVSPIEAAQPAIPKPESSDSLPKTDQISSWFAWLKQEKSRREFLKGSGKVAGGIVAHQLINKVPGLNSLADMTAQVENKEKISQQAETVIIDFAPTVPNAELNQTKFVTPQEVLNAIGTDRMFDVTEMTTAVPSEKPVTNAEEFEKYIKSNWNELNTFYADKPKQIAKLRFTYYTLMFFNQKKDHGQEVVTAFRKASKWFGEKETPTRIIPSQEMFLGNDVDIEDQEKDENEYGVSVRVTAENAVPLLQEAKSISGAEHTVFNLSWQLGEQGLGRELCNFRVIVPWETTYRPDGNTYFFVFPEAGIGEEKLGPNDGEEQVIDGIPHFIFFPLPDGSVPPPLIALPQPEAEKLFDHLEGIVDQQFRDGEFFQIPVILISDAYRPEAVSDSVIEIQKLANEFPEDVLVMCAGNNYDDLRGQDIPENALIVGEWKNRLIKRTSRVYGADIYVPNRELALGNGSSFSTPFISALAKELINTGTKVTEVKSVIQQQFCNVEAYRARLDNEPDSTLEHTYVIDLEKVKRYFPNFKLDNE